jgi:hypothetical protein
MRTGDVTIAREAAVLDPSRNFGDGTINAFNPTAGA